MEGGRHEGQGRATAKAGGKAEGKSLARAVSKRLRRTHSGGAGASECSDATTVAASAATTEDPAAGTALRRMEKCTRHRRLHQTEIVYAVVLWCSSFALPALVSINL